MYEHSLTHLSKLALSLQTEIAREQFKMYKIYLFSTFSENGC